MKKTSLFVTVILILTLILTLSNPASAKDKYYKKTVREQLNVSYGGRTYNMIITRPDAPGSFPSILMLNGFNETAMAQQGFIVITGHVEDENAAIAIMDRVKKSNKSNGKFGVTGHSWGGAMSMVIGAAAKGKVQAVVEMGGLLHPNNRIDLAKDMKCAVMFISGEHDNLAPPAAVKRMYDRMKKSGRPTEMYIVPGEGHGFGGRSMGTVFRKAVAFFKKNLK